MGTRAVVIGGVVLAVALLLWTNWNWHFSISVERRVHAVDTDSKSLWVKKDIITDASTADRNLPKDAKQKIPALDAVREVRKRTEKGVTNWDFSAKQSKAAVRSIIKKKENPVVPSVDAESAAFPFPTFEVDSTAYEVKVALVALVRDSADFSFWLEYYLTVLAFDLLILRVEDCPQCREQISAYGDRIVATYSYDSGLVDKSNMNNIRVNSTHHSIESNYHTMQGRQKMAVNGALTLCKERDIDFLLHSDADELLYVQPNPAHLGMPRKLQLRKYLSDVPLEYDNLHLDNYEALYPSFNYDSNEKCFMTNRFLRCWEGQCACYANGKSIARVQGLGFGNEGKRPPIEFWGPHWFSGRSFDLNLFHPVNPALAILHFDSCTFQQWEIKFTLLKETNDTILNSIPFVAYQKSIKMQQERARNPGNDLVKRAAIDLYKSLKVNNYFTSDYYLLRYLDTNKDGSVGEDAAPAPSRGVRKRVRYDAEINGVPTQGKPVGSLQSSRPDLGNRPRRFSAPKLLTPKQRVHQSTGRKARQ